MARTPQDCLKYARERMVDLGSHPIKVFAMPKEGAPRTHGLLAANKKRNVGVYARGYDPRLGKVQRIEVWVAKDLEEALAMFPREVRRCIGYTDAYLQYTDDDLPEILLAPSSITSSHLPMQIRAGRSR